MEISFYIISIVSFLIWRALEICFWIWLSATEYLPIMNIHERNEWAKRVIEVRIWHKNHLNKWAKLWIISRAVVIFQTYLFSTVNANWIETFISVQSGKLFHEKYYLPIIFGLSQKKNEREHTHGDNKNVWSRALETLLTKIKKQIGASKWVFRVCFWDW